MQVRCDPDEGTGRTGRCKGGIHDHQNRADGDIPAPPLGPVLGVLDIVGGKVELALVIQVNVFSSLEASRTVWLGGRPREDALEMLHVAMNVGGEVRRLLLLTSGSLKLRSE